MSGLVVLDVFIGLIFIYVLYSLFATVIMEIISSFFSMRARNLELTIYRMLTDESSNKNNKNHQNEGRTKFNLLDWFGNSGLGRLIYGIVLSIKRLFNFPKSGLVKDFYNHPNIKYLSEGKYFNKPSYIKNETFAWTLLEVLKSKGSSESQSGTDSEKVNDALLSETSNVPKGDTRDLLSAFWRDAQGDLEKYKSILADWFDTTNERAAGWFKRNTQFQLLAIGLLLAIFFGVDTIEIAKKLSTDKAAREQTVQLATAYIESHSVEDGGKSKEIVYREMQDSLQKDLDELNGVMGLGWDDKSLSCILCAVFRSHGGLGYLLTALAISLGAPFWFDLLNKVVKLRSSIPQTTSGQSGGKQPTAKTTSMTGGVIPARQRKG